MLQRVGTFVPDADTISRRVNGSRSIAKELQATMKRYMLEPCIRGALSVPLVQASDTEAKVGQPRLNL